MDTASGSHAQLGAEPQHLSCLKDSQKSYRFSAVNFRTVQNQVIVFIGYLPAASGKVMQKCRSKKGLMDFETLKPLFLVLFGTIFSSFEPV